MWSKEHTTDQYIDKITTNYDTIMLLSDAGVDTIYSYQPCDSFIRIVRQKDTVYVRQIKKEVQTKLVVKRDTVFRTPVITENVKIKNVAKGGSAIGDGNKITTKRTSWWWIFLAGMLTWFVIQNVIWKLIKRHLVLPI